MSGDQPQLYLLCQVEAWLCGLPLEHIVETMRPLPVEPFVGAPEFVSGLSIIRGVPLPVIDTGALLGVRGCKPTRFVTIKAENRRVVLAFDAVLGVRAIPANSLQDLPPSLRDAGAEMISAIGALDAELLLVLRSARVVPESVWAALELEGASR